MAEETLTEEQLDAKALAMAKENHIWLNAFSCINPTKEFQQELGATILRWLDSRDRLLPATTGKLGRLTPVLYLTINKS